MKIPPKSADATRVLAFGTFDILHPGHIDFLKNAKALGAELFIILARDTTVQKRKGKAPHFSEQIRLRQVQKLQIATAVLLGEESDYLKLPKEIDPDIIVLGYDQEAPLNIIAAELPQAKITRLLPHFPEEFKSSKLRTIFPASFDS